MSSSFASSTAAPAKEESCPAPRALCGWSPPDTDADTPLKRAIDRIVPRSGVGVFVYFGTVIAMLLIAPLLAKRGELTMDGMAAAVAAAWCGLNFFRCRQAHCLVTASGWSALALFTFVEATLGRSVLPGNVHGDEQLVFLAILVAGVVFEVAWSRVRGTNAVVARSVTNSVT
jgi:hypothetical protein